MDGMASQITHNSTLFSSLWDSKAQNIKSLITDFVWGESIGDLVNPLTKGK